MLPVVPALRIATRSKIAPTSREERVVTLAGEDPARRPSVTIVFSRGGLVVLDPDEPVEARADVVDRRLAARERLGRSARTVHVCCVLPRKYGPGRRLEAEAVRDVRLPVAVPVDVDVVPGALGERVVVRPSGGILAGDPVGDDREGVRLVRAAERVQVRVVRSRILRDQRRLPVARRVARAGGEAGDEERGERCADDRQQNECLVLAHSVRLLSDGRSVGESVGRGRRTGR